jgi:hypothetical protein
MGNFGWVPEQTALVLIAAAIATCALFMLRTTAKTMSVPLAFGFACFLFVIFKVANVRQGHQFGMWTALAISVFVLVLILSPSSIGNPRFAARFVGFAILSCAFMVQIVWGWREAVEARTAALSALAYNAAAWHNPGARIAQLTKQRRAVESDLAKRVPDGLNSTVASWPWEFSELLAANVKFETLPSLQGYANYTPKLREATRRFFEADTRPEHLFFQLAPLDGRYSTTELGPALISVLAGYDIVRPNSRLLGSPAQLRRRLSKRTVALRPIEQKTVPADQWIEVPCVTEGLVIGIRPAERLAGKLLTLLYKQAALQLDLRFANGVITSSVIFPNLSSDRFLVLPPGLTDVQLVEAAADGLQTGRSNPLVALRVRMSSSTALRFRPDYELSVDALSMTGATEHPLLKDPPAKDAMEALITGRILGSPDVRLVEGRLFAHAPTRISAVMPSRGLLTGEIGFFDGAWKEGKPRPVTFSISAVVQGTRQSLFERTLDPVARPDDRGPQTFTVDISEVDLTNGGPELLFETGPETSWGWTYWSNLHITQ